MTCSSVTKSLKLSARLIKGLSCSFTTGLHMKLIIPPPVQGLIAGSAMWMVDNYLSVAPFEFQGRIPIAFGLIAIGQCVELIAIGAFIKARTTVNPMAPDRATDILDSLFG